MKCESGEIGRRTRLRIWRGNPWGFESPPVSYTHLALLETLNILDGYDLAALGDRSPSSMHLITEAFRRAFKDRTSFLGDPDFQSMPTSQLIDKRYAAAWRKDISMTRATPSDSLTRPAGYIACLLYTSRCV